MHQYKTQNIHIMKKSILLFCSVAIALLGYSCSSDDDSPIIDDEQTTLVGSWQLETVDFSHIEEDAHPAYKSDFCFMEYISGYEFREDGNFIFVAYDDKFGTNELEDGEESIWKWEGDIDSFVLIQTNPNYPPYDMSIAPENIQIEKVDGEWILTFDAEMYLGSTGTFKLVKTESVDDTVKPELTENGEDKEACGLLG